MLTRYTTRPLPHEVVVIGPTRIIFDRTDITQVTVYTEEGEKVEWVAYETVTIERPFTPPTLDERVTALEDATAFIAEMMIGG